MYTFSNTGDLTLRKVALWNLITASAIEGSTFQKCHDDKPANHVVAKRRGLDANSLRLQPSRCSRPSLAFSPAYNLVNSGLYQYASGPGYPAKPIPKVVKNLYYHVSCSTRPLLRCTSRRIILASSRSARQRFLLSIVRVAIQIVKERC